MEIPQVMHRDQYLTSFICLTCLNGLNVAFEFKRKCDRLNEPASGRKNIKRISADAKSQQKPANRVNQSHANADDTQKPNPQQIDEGNQFDCAYCMRTFHTRYAIQQHLSRHQTKRQQYDCQKCGLRFLAVTHLTEHRCECQN